MTYAHPSRGRALSYECVSRSASNEQLSVGVNVAKASVIKKELGSISSSRGAQRALLSGKDVFN